MDNLLAIGVGLGLRALIDNVTNHNHRLNGSLLGLWEGAVLRHFISTYPASIDPYVAYGFRLLVDLLWTTSWVRLFITILWSFMGMLLSDVFVDLWADRRFRRFTRHVRHSVIYPLLSLFSSRRRRSSGSSTGSAPRAQYYQIPASSSATSTARSPTSLRSPTLQPRSPTDVTGPPFRPPAPTPAVPRRSALRVPGSFSSTETDTEAGRGSRTPSVAGSRSSHSVTFSDQVSRTPSVTSSQEPVRLATHELPRSPPPEPVRAPSREPSRTPIPGPSSRTPSRRPSIPLTRPRSPSELEYVPDIPDNIEQTNPVRPVLSDDELSLHEDLRARSDQSGLTTPEKDEDRPRIDVYSPEPLKSGLTTPIDRPSTPRTRLPPVTVLDEAGTQVSGADGGSDINPIPIPIRVYERGDAEDQAQARNALLHPELIPDINTPQPSPGINPPAEFIQDNMRPGSSSRMKMPMPEPARSSTMSQPPPPYEPTPGENESQADSPADSIISNVQDRERLLKRAETLRDKADETDKRRAVLKRAYEDARRTGQHWEAFRLKHEMDRAVQETRELHAKAARRFYQAHNMKPQPQTIDVHRLKVPEAIEKVEQALYDAIVTSTPELRIITGQGKHSKNKIPALKLAIIGAMADYHIDAVPDATNPGVLLIRPPATLPTSSSAS
ncbi:hypothetical protein ONZ51_g8331 [Trametes cubensis]|uniref:Smr domain-containing protein n=1 Tax=Trametes cubensis TaxID=1111947 RepID=A0AAD7TNV4_9APHY|nr:hypothetical protein ONZ51_g8331 [Trametes cubensis]